MWAGVLVGAVSRRVERGSVVAWVMGGGAADCRASRGCGPDVTDGSTYWELRLELVKHIIVYSHAQADVGAWFTGFAGVYRANKNATKVVAGRVWVCGWLISCSLMQPRWRHAQCNAARRCCRD
jgi:hypothetical protein